MTEIEVAIMMLTVCKPQFGVAGGVEEAYMERKSKQESKTKCGKLFCTISP